MKRVITMTLEGVDDDALDDAQAEAWNRIKAGNREGQDRNESGEFSFTVEHPDAPNPEEARYRSYAQGYLHRDGDLEFDDNAVVSMGSDPGAYVQGWKWVDQCDLPDEGDEGDEGDN
jgi:hypothetical protein